MIKWCKYDTSWLHGLHDLKTLSGFQVIHTFSRMPKTPISAAEAQAIFFTVNAINQSDTRRKWTLRRGKAFGNDVTEINISYHVSILSLEKGNLFLIKYAN